MKMFKYLFHVTGVIKFAKVVGAVKPTLVITMFQVPMETAILLLLQVSHIKVMTPLIGYECTALFLRGAWVTVIRHLSNDKRSTQASLHVLYW